MRARATVRRRMGIHLGSRGRPRLSRAPAVPTSQPASVRGWGGHHCTGGAQDRYALPQRRHPDQVTRRRGRVRTFRTVPSRKGRRRRGHRGHRTDRAMSGVGARATSRPDAARPSRLRRAGDAHLGSRDGARVIYGAIIGLALVVAPKRHPPTAGQAAVALLATAVAVALAEMYSEYVGAEARGRRRLTRSEVRTLAGEAGAVLFGAAFPAVFLILAAAGVMRVETALTLAQWTGLGLICGYAYLAARLAGSTRLASLGHAAAL